LIFSLKSERCFPDNHDGTAINDHDTPNDIFNEGSGGDFASKAVSS
jgi:hypothetical protein